MDLENPGGASPLSFSNFYLHVSGLQAIRYGYPKSALKLPQNN